MHSILGLLSCIPGGWGALASGIDAAIYLFVDHDYGMAVLSAMRTLSFGFGKLTRGGTVTRTASVLQTTSRLLSNTATFGMNAQAGMSVAFEMYDKYVIQGQSFSLSTLVEVGELGMSVAGCIISARGIGRDVKELGKLIRESAFMDKLKQSVCGMGRTLNSGGINNSEVPKTVPQQLTREGQVPAIGKMRDLNIPENVVDGEFKVADYLPDMGNPKDNWHQNSGILRSVMNERVPIKDVSIYPMNNAGFLGAERNLLQSRDWTYLDGYWYPPQ